VAAAGIDVGRSLTWRNRVTYPAWQNFWYERIVPRLYTIGSAWASATGGMFGSDRQS
jgi:hypothetical protein